MMSQEVLYTLFGFALFLCALYISSTTTTTATQSASREQSSQLVATKLNELSASAKELRNSLFTSKKILDHSGPLSITVSIDDVLFTRCSSSDSPMLFINKAVVLRAMTLLCEFAHVRLLLAATSDEVETRAREQLGEELLSATASCACPILPHRVLCYSTSIGKTAMVRHILPDVHIDSDPSLCEAMHPFVGSVVQVGGGAALPPLAWRVVGSLEDLIPTAPLSTGDNQ